MSIADFALPYVRAISPYQPGKPVTELAREMNIPLERIVKLASNENPLGTSPRVRHRCRGRRARAGGFQQSWSALAKRGSRGFQKNLWVKMGCSARTACASSY